MPPIRLRPWRAYYCMSFPAEAYTTGSVGQPPTLHEKGAPQYCGRPLIALEAHDQH